MDLWDKKAKNYVRYGKLNDIQKQTFEKINELNIDFINKNIVDIGCGTGVWTLHLAQKAKSVLGVDNSKAMLEILQEDALKNNTNNVKTLHLDFESFYKENQEKFDIAFLSMSPALQNENDFKAFLNLASQRIYLGWADYRKSDFLDPIFKHFNTEFKGCYKKDLESFLLEKNINFYKFVFDEERVVYRSKDEAIENALWHLSMNNIKTNREKITKFIKSDIKETIVSKIKLLVL
ncbi:class I SAM-dependent methyltransferase [Campylobacter taeniopygiae]|uniref:Class I SAM-dependent methyltransferase n=1 Tax=Campylobacter taeniopygiae TaxID=2510188 RepID=A0ABY2TIN3_9BACT|nr:class I SAM-dependent methyltransferase [Campylobacter taeniopygiae]TKX33701.1 class I SAM-dependent methyltransferase [Campylobacter taeniopygiae]